MKYIFSLGEKVYHKVRRDLGEGTIIEISGCRFRVVFRRFEMVGLYNTFEPVLDSEGYSQYGRDADGYSMSGYDIYGYDRTGYDINGFDKDGFDQDGYDRSGYDKIGFDRNGYDRRGLNESGFDQSGYNTKGFDKNNLHKDTNSRYDQCGFDSNGFDLSGYDCYGKDAWGCGRDGYDNVGFDRDGYNRSGRSRKGFDREGYDENNFNCFGYDRNGFDIDGYNCNGRDVFGYDLFGYDRDGFNKDGFDRYGYDRFGYDKNGFGIKIKNSNDEIWDREQHKINKFVDDILAPQVVSQTIPSLIPQSFFLGQTKIDVCLDGNLSSQDKGIGKSDCTQDKLNVGKFSSIREAEKDFINKLVHFIFIKLEKHKLSYDEVFQDDFSSFLYQALSTAKPSFWSANAITGFHYINSEEYPFDSLFKEEEYQDHIKYWSNPEMNSDDCELIEVYDECDIIHLEFDRQSLICDDFWDGFDEQKYIAQMVKEQEEAHLAFLEELEEEQREIEYYRHSSQDSWTDVSDSWTRSEDEGWYYDDDD